MELYETRGTVLLISAFANGSLPSFLTFASLTKTRTQSSSCSLADFYIKLLLGFCKWMLKEKCQQLPTFPLKSSIIGVRELDFRVRNGNGYYLSTMATGNY